MLLLAGGDLEEKLHLINYGKLTTINEFANINNKTKQTDSNLIETIRKLEP